MATKKYLARRHLRSCVLHLSWISHHVNWVVEHYQLNIGLDGWDSVKDRRTRLVDYIHQLRSKLEATLKDLEREISK